MRRRLALLLALGAASCGAKTGLSAGNLPPDKPVVDASAETGGPPTSAYCATASYRSGHDALAIYLLLDRSGSMQDDNKWDDATTAIDAFVNSPQAAGISLALQYFPIGAECDVAGYAKPAVPFASLPGQATGIEASIAGQTTTQLGGTPTLPALRGGLEYARAQLIANPQEAVVVALVTDGVPNTCDSTTQAVSAIAREGVTGAPQVLTFVIGLEAGAVKAMNTIAKAGGTGSAVLVGKGTDSAQKIVDALQFLRQTQTSCQYAIPDTGGGAVGASDVAVSFTLAAGATPTPLARVGGASACEITNAFYLDDPALPTRVELCPGACDNLKQSPGSKVTVSAGCGGGSDAGLPDSGPGDCSGVIDFGCVTDCASLHAVDPVCAGSDWVCPPGSVDSIACATCEPVPHGCCKPDGTLSTGQCVNGAWQCPPNAKLFGEPGCAPPDVCSKLLPCGAGQYCSYPDLACGTTDVAGHCVAIPKTCAGGGTATCGCDGKLHPSECDAAAQGADPSLVTSCAAPAGTFACGPYFCKAGQICREISDLSQAIGGQSYACVDAPAGCATGCGCKLCGACPAGKTCKEACKQGDGPMLVCTRF